jgi:hypothetical protein
MTQYAFARIENIQSDDGVTLSAQVAVRYWPTTSPFNDNPHTTTASVDSIAAGPAAIARAIADHVADESTTAGVSLSPNHVLVSALT